MNRDDAKRDLYEDRPPGGAGSGEGAGEAHPPPGAGVLAIDHGDARIGLAASDDLGMMAHPLETLVLRQHADPIARILELAAGRRTRLIVLGLPLRSDGSEGTAAAKVRRFGDKLSRRLPAGVRLVYHDERWTTCDAQERLRQAGKKARRQKPVIDQAAAVEILNDWLRQIGPGGDTPPWTEP